MKNIEIESVESRRSFLKKAAYAAPVIVSLGALTIPATAGASVFTHYTVSATSGANTSVATITTKDGTNIVEKGDFVNIPDFPTNSSYTISGETVKVQADLDNETWSWVDDIFGSSTWIGKP